MIVELIFAFASRAVSLALHLGHLLQAVEHGRDNPLVLRVDNLADVEGVGTVQLRLDAGDKDLREAQDQLLRAAANSVCVQHTGKTRTKGTTPFRFLSVSLVCSMLRICSFCARELPGCEAISEDRGFGRRTHERSSAASDR